MPFRTLILLDGGRQQDITVIVTFSSAPAGYFEFVVKCRVYQGDVTAQNTNGSNFISVADGKKPGLVK